MENVDNDRWSGYHRSRNHSQVLHYGSFAPDFVGMFKTLQQSINCFQKLQICRIGSEVVYRRLPWKEPDTPYLLEILYEDDEMVNAL